MIKILSIAFMVILTLHGLIHLMGLIAYWPLGKIAELPYKTTLMGDLWEVGSTGIRLYSLLWLLATIGFLCTTLALALGRSWWAPVLLGSVLLSGIICILDWKAAFRGAWIDLALLLILFVVFGLRVQPASLQSYSGSSTVDQTIPLPQGLPTPVERYYRQTYGDKIPVYHSAVISGSGSVRLMGITFPARLRFSHISGEEYRHYIEATFYGLPILKVNEYYVDGHNRLELPFAVQEGDAGVDSAANQGLWAETFAYPAFFLTDPRIRWEPMDETHAKLYVPYNGTEQVFTVQFDAQSGLVTRYETERYHDAKDGVIRWWGDVMPTEGQDGISGKVVITAVWEDEGTPWLVFKVDNAVFNADLSAYIRQKGP